MKNSYRIQVLFTVLAMVLVTLACGTSNTGEKVGESSSPTTAPAKVEVFKAGDTIKVEDYTITMDSAQVQGSKLLANFTIDNTSGTKEQAISSMMSFSAKDTDGNKLDFSFCDGSQLDGTVLVGDKLKGNVCWDGVRTDSIVKIYYVASFLGSGAIVWEVDN
jgi:hypothetical protein